MGKRPDIGPVNDEAVAALSEIVAREKAMLHERLERARADQDGKSKGKRAGRRGKLYEVFQALGE